MDKIDQMIETADNLRHMSLYKGARSMLKKAKKMPGKTPEQIARINELHENCSGFLASDPTPSLADHMRGTGELE